MFEDEEWLPIKDFPHYLISNYGRVKHTDRIMARRVGVNERGFPVITLQSGDSDTRYLRQVNKLVADAFLPPPTFDPKRGTAAVWHIDGDLTNCNADNLKWELRTYVLEWNEMHRGRTSFKQIGKVKNNQTGVIYDNTYECAMAEGELESKIIWRIEQQARDLEDDNARYRYIFSDKDSI